MNREQKQILAKKLEYRFKNSDIGKEFLIKLNENKPITSIELTLLIGKLEYRFKNSDGGKEFIKSLTWHLL